MALTRPFRNAHITLPIILLLGAEYLLLATSCHEDNSQAATVLATAVVCLAGWLAHLRTGPVNGWRVLPVLIWETLGDVLKFGLTVVLVWLALALVSPVGECYGPRLYVSGLMTAASTTRTEIGRRYAERHTLANIGEGLQMAPLRSGDWSRITPDGSIVLFSSRATAVIVLTPSAGPEGLAWSCTGTPAKYLPGVCRLP